MCFGSHGTIYKSEIFLRKNEILSVIIRIKKQIDVDGRICLSPVKIKMSRRKNK